MFTFENLSFRYRDYLFEDFSGTIPETQIGIVGRNGSGKTTLLRLLDRQLSPQGGSVTVAGSTYLVDFELRRYRNFHLSDLVSLCARLRSFDVARAPEYLRELNLDDYTDLPLGELSKGVTKKVALLLGLMSMATILLVDEPFESVDAESNENLIRVLRSQERGLVVVSHDLDHLRRSVDAVYRVENKSLVRTC